MARLPSSEQLGSLPSANSGRQMSSIDASPVGDAMMSVSRGLAVRGRGIQQAGQQIAEGIDFAAKSLKQDDDLNDAQTRADFLVEKIKLDNERDNEVDPNKLRSFPERYQKLTETFATRYSDPRRKQKFLIETQDDVVRGGLSAGDKVLRIERDTFKAGAMDQLETLRRSGLEAKDEPTKQKVIEQGIQQFRLLREKGIIDASQEVSARQKWVRDYTIDSIKMLPAEQRLEAVQGWRGALKVRESSGDHTVENQFGFAGLYQFGAPRLQTIGVYKPGASENLDAWNSTGKTAPGKWSGTFNIPGFPNVKTKADFLANPDAQEAVFNLHQQKMDAEIKDQGLERYIGQTVGGVKITREGIYSMMHLGGAGGAALALKSGGVINNKDANGASLLEYAALGLKGPSKMMDFLDPLERQSIEQGASQELMQKSRIAEQEARQFQAVKNAERSAILDDLQIGLSEDRYGPAEVMQARQAGLLTDPEKFNKIEKLLKDQGERRERAELLTGVMTGTAVYNPTNPDHIKAAEEGVDAVSRATGLPKEQAAYTIYDRTGVMPKSGVQAMRGQILQNTPDSILAVGTIAARAMYEPSARFPNGNGRVFDGFDGGKEVAEIGTLFKHMTGMGLDPYEAAKRISAMKAPDYKSPVKMGEKEEQEFVKGLKENAAKDMGNASLFGSGMVFDNKMLPGPLKNQMLEDYASEALFFYKKYGDEGAAKQFAMDAMKKVYGVSNGFIQKFPVEKAYENFQIGSGGTNWVYEQAIQKVQSVAGVTAKKEDVFFTEVPMATAEAFRSGGPVPYHVHYFRDVNGQRVLERLPNAVMPNATKAYTEHLAKITADATATRNDNRQLQGPQTPSVDNGGINPRRMNPGRPMKTPAEIEAEKADLMQRGGELRSTTEQGRVGGAGTPEQRNQRISEGIAQRRQGEEPPRLPEPVDNWLRSTPANPLKGFVQSRNRSRLPGGEK